MRIEDYALIGDTQSAAIVGRNGSIDCLRLPRFDSGACFAALLGTPEHGRWLLAPEAKCSRIARRYHSDSLVLETEMTTDGGVVRLTDCMPIRSKYPDVVRVTNGFVNRYDTRDSTDMDGLHGREGAFLACSWLVDAYVLAGRAADAKALFERLVGVCNDVGLLSEEYDTERGRLVGNFPQAFSHVALVNSAFNLSEHTGPVRQRAST